MFSMVQGLFLGWGLLWAMSPHSLEKFPCSMQYQKDCAGPVELSSRNLTETLELGWPIPCNLWPLYILCNTIS